MMREEARIEMTLRNPNNSSVVQERPRFAWSGRREQIKEDNFN